MTPTATRRYRLAGGPWYAADATYSREEARERLNADFADHGFDASDLDIRDCCNHVDANRAVRSPQGKSVRGARAAFTVRSLPAEARS